MEKYKQYKEAFPNKTDAQIIESLAWELTDKVETIHKMLPAIKISRIWAMPNSLTFTIKPIKELIERYVQEGNVIIDPWANNSKIGTIRNDLNPEMDTHFHFDALKAGKYECVGLKNFFDITAMIKRMADHQEETTRRRLSC